MSLLIASLLVMAADPLKVLVLDLRADNVPESTARLVRDEIAVDMGRDARLDVLSSEDLRRVVSVEADKQAAGCDESTCLAEVGAALGARYIVHGSIGKLGGTTIVHLNLFDTEGGRSVARETAEAPDADALLPSVRVALARVRARMLGDAPPVEAPPDKPMSFLTLAGGSVLALGALAAVGGGAMMAVAWPAFSNGKAPDAGGVTSTERQQAQVLGQAGTGALGIGAAVAVGGAVLLGLGLME